MPDAVALSRPLAGYAPQQWEIKTAVNGRGTLLVGPLAAPDSVSGAWVFAPPGVRLATPLPVIDDLAAPPLSVFGWREAYWTIDGEGNALVDHGRPAALDACRLSDVLDHVYARCPEHLGWVAGQLESHVRGLHLQTRRDAAGRRAPSAALAARTLATFVDDSEQALHAFDERSAQLNPIVHGLRAGSLRSLSATLEGLARIADEARTQPCQGRWG